MRSSGGGGGEIQVRIGRGDRKKIREKSAGRIYWLCNGLRRSILQYLKEKILSIVV